MQNSVNIEKRVLGICFFKPEYVQIILDTISIDCFLEARNKIIFNAIKSLHEENKEIELQLLISYLVGIEELSAVGGEDYLLEIQEDIFDVKDIKTLYGYLSELRNSEISKKYLEIADFISDKTKTYEGLKGLGAILDKKIISINQSITFDNENVAPKKLIDDTVNYILKKKELNEQAVKTYIYELDQLLTTINPQTLTVIGAKTGLGKTSFALNLMVRNALDNNPCFMYSLEMSKIEIVIKLFSILSRFKDDPAKFLSLDEINNFRPEDVETLKKISNSASDLYNIPLYIQDVGTAKTNQINDIINMVRYYTRTYNLKLVVIDYMQLLEHVDRDLRNRTQVLGYISRRLKLLAMELNIPIVVLAQLSREADKVERPRRYHLRESGSIEHDADNILLLHNKEDEPALIEDMMVIIEKQRAGRVGEVMVTFDKKYSLFT